MRSSALVAACHSAACRPPTSGGTGGSSKATTTRAFDRKIRSGSESVRKAAETQLAESIYSGKTPIYHGSKADLKVGDTIKPTSTNANTPGDARPKAFATRHMETTLIFGGSKGTQKIYKVEPLERDLEFRPTSAIGVHIMSAKGFKVAEVMDKSPVPSNRLGVRRQASIEAQRRIAAERRTKRADRMVENDPKLKAAIDKLMEALK